MRRLPSLVLLVVTSLPLAAQEPPPVPPPLPPAPGFQPGLDNLPPPAAQQFKDLVPALIEGLGDVDNEVRQHSALALAAVGKDAIKPLSQALKEGSRERRAAAAYALGQMGMFGRDALPDLIKAMKDEEPVVRRSVAQAMSRILSNEAMMYGNFGPFAGGGGIGVMPGNAGVAPAIAPLPVPKADNPDIKPEGKKSERPK